MNTNIKYFPTINLEATGKNIKKKLAERNIKVSQLQKYYNFDAPQAIYKWLNGKSLPTIDNLCALASYLGVTIDELLVLDTPNIPSPTTLTSSSAVSFSCSSDAA